jgi:serine/threonine protein kinase
MKPLDDAALSRLREAVSEPDFSGTRYRILSVAGRGGMGTVYVAEDALLSRKVALKVLETSPQREAQVLAGLEHPGIVPVHDAGTLPDGRHWYAMKLVQGARLDEALQRPSGLNERLRIFLQICEVIAFAHAHGVLHRDLKPQNIMLGAFGEVLVLDWGLARRLSEAADGARAGTQGFRAPDKAQDAQTDVYSLGAILALMQPLPSAVEAIAAKAAAAREDRYSSVSALAADVERFLEGAAISAVPEGLWAKSARLISRHRIAAAIVCAYLAGRGLILFFTGH